MRGKSKDVLDNVCNKNVCIIMFMDGLNVESVFGN